MPGERTVIPSGLAFAVPPGYEMQIRPRSGLARQHGVTVLNAPGTLDSDFRGELGIILINHATTSVIVNHHDRVAQVVVVPVPRVELEEVLELDITARGAGGYGSTGR